MDFNKFKTLRTPKGDTIALLQECLRYGALRNQAAYLMATFEHETAGTFKPVQEAFWLSDKWRRKNLRYYPWHGRGHVQMTWEANYRKAEKLMGVPFTKDPTLAMQSEHSVVFSVVGTMEGWWTGKRIDDYITLKKSDFRGARRCVNGLDKATHIANLAKKWDKQLLEAGYGVEGVTPVGEPGPDPVEAPTVTPEEAEVEPTSLKEALIEALLAAIKAAVIAVLSNWKVSRA